MESKLQGGELAALPSVRCRWYVSYGLIALAIFLFSPVAWAATACKVNYSVASQWGSGFTGNVSVTNTGDPWTIWAVTWDMPNNQQITGLWNGSYTQSGAAVSVKNVSWNGNVANNTAVQFGFNASYTGTNAIPSNVSVNGVLCTGNASPPKPPVTACDVSYKVTNQWGNGFSAEVIIANKADPWTNWAVTWDLVNGQKIVGLSNGQLTQNGGAVKVTHGGWNATIAADGKLQFNFNATHNGTNDLPTNVSINGVLCSGNAATPPPPPPPQSPITTCEAKYVISKEWGDGTGYTADVLVKNTGSPLDGWTLVWDMPNEQKIVGLWNGTHTQNAKRIEVKHASWNQNIASGTTIELGFNAVHEGLNQIPGNISLNGIKCAGQVEPPPPPPPSCAVNYRIQNQWDNGFAGTVDIENTGLPWNGWETTWTMPTGQKIIGGSNGVFTQEGDVVKVKNADFNKIVIQNKSISFGFNASQDGTNLIPIDVAVNGVRCTGQAEQLLHLPKTPANFQGTLVDNTYVDLHWTDNNTEEDNVVVERREIGGNWSVLLTLAADSTVYQDKSLVIGKVYEYRIKAGNAIGFSAYSTVSAFSRQDRTNIRAAMLANNCSACHGSDGKSVGLGIPSINGLDRSYFIRTMQAYRTGTRASSVMGRIAKGYTDTQIERMADYFGNIPFVAATQVTDQTLVNRGKGIHTTHCMFCHSAVDNGIDQTKARLNGQWSTYIHATLEDYFAGRSSNVPGEMASQMQHLKTSYGDDALLALAQYYAADAQAKAAGGGDDDGNAGNDGNDDGGNTGDDDNTDDDTGGGSSSLPVAPSNLVSNTVDNAKISIGWRDQSNNESGFRMERRPAGGADGDWRVLADIGSNTESFTDATVALGNRYEYRVLAVNAAGSTPSEPVSAELLTLLKYGELQYQRQSCASCHGLDGKGGFTQVPLTQFTPTNLTHLSNDIRDTMPPANPAVCVGNCALGIAHYITEVLAPAAVGDNDSKQACEDSPPPGKRSLRLLTRQEYQNTVNDLLGLSLSLVHELPEENRVEGFDNNAESNLVTGLRMESYLNQAEKLAGQAVQQNWGKIMPCNTYDATCAQRFIKEFGKRAFRRPLTTEEVSGFYANFTYFNEANFRNAVEDIVMRMLSSAHFLYRSELGELQADGTYQLTPYEVAGSLSYLFLGSMPDTELFLAADNNQLATAQQRITQASRLLALPRSRQQVGNFVGQWLLSSSPYLLPDKDPSVYPQYTSAVREAMSQELITFFNHVAFDSTQSFNELLTADYVFANKALADFYHLSGPTGTALEKTPVTDGTRTGLLTLGAVLARYANSAESHPFKRGAFFFERMLCHDLAPPENAGVVIPPKQDPNATTRERFDFHSKSMPACYSCHQYIDGPGFSFETYDGSGQFRMMENDKVIEVSGFVRGMETYSPDEEISFSDLMTLSQLTSTSDTAAQCAARQYYRYTTGRMETSADECALDSYLKTYADSGYNLQTMLLSIVNAPSFTVRSAE